MKEKKIRVYRGRGIGPDQSIQRIHATSIEEAREKFEIILNRKMKWIKLDPNCERPVIRRWRGGR